MQWLRWIVIVLALLEGGWFAFDGTRALIVGDYITPKTGPHAGQLGGWSKIVSAVGIEPRSTLMRCIHVALGAAWLVAILAFALDAAWGWRAMLACAIASLWYMPVGTVLSLLQIVLLCLPAVRPPLH